MVLLQIIFIFVAIPAAMITASLLTGTSGARAVTYLLFPLALLVFAVAMHRRDGGDSEGDAGP
jgi:hypothetical protein